MNRVQFQSRLSMAQFIQQYGTVAKCYRCCIERVGRRGALPRCNGRPRPRFCRAGRMYCQCCGCRHHDKASGIVNALPPLEMREDG